MVNTILCSVTFGCRLFLPDIASPIVKINSDKPIVFSVSEKILIHINDSLTIEKDIPILLKETANVKIINSVTVNNCEENCLKKQDSINNNLEEEKNE